MAAINVNYSQNVDTAFNPFFLTLYSTVGTANGKCTDGFTWAAGGALPASVSWRDAVYGNGVTIAVASGLTAASSFDTGTTWVARTMPSSANWGAISFGDNKFITVASNSTAGALSTDGITWSGMALPSANNWNSMAYGNDRFVVLDATAGTDTLRTCVYSGLSWTTYTATITSPGTWTSICYGNNQFVAVCQGSAVAATSPDGINWTSHSLPVSSNWSSVCWGGAGFNVANKYVAVSATSGTIAASSEDGVTWTPRTLPATGVWNSVTWGGSNGIFSAVNNTSGAGGAASSPDGINWTSRTTAAANSRKNLFAPQTWNSGDTLTINNGAVLTINTSQTKFWGTIAIAATGGQLNITNSSMSTPIRFGMGRAIATASRHTITPANGLGSVTAQGNWIEIGTSTGLPNQTFTSPYTTGDYIPSVWVETASGLNAYEPWVNVTGFRDFDIFRFARNGIRGVGGEDGGTCFTQSGDRATVQYLNLTNCSVTNGSNYITCASTTGLQPGTFVTGRAIPATGVVQEIIDATTFKINIACTGTYSGIPIIGILPICSQYTTSLNFGNGVNGKIPPAGAKIRVPNVMITDYTAANFFNAGWSSTNTPCCFIGSAAAPFTFNTCLFGESYADYTQAQKATFTNVGLCYIPYVTECYEYAYNNVGCGSPPVVQYLTAATALGATGSTNSTTTITTPATNAIIPGVLITGTNLHACTAVTVVSNTSTIVSTAAYGSAGTTAFTYYGNWTPRNYQMVQSATIGAYSVYSAIQALYVSNAVIRDVVLAYGGYVMAAAQPGAASQANGMVNLAYSNDVIIDNVKGIRLGSYTRNRPYETGINLVSAGNNIAVTDSTFYNTNVLATTQNANITVTNTKNKHGINNEGYQFAAGQRAYKDPNTGNDLLPSTKYWFKTRSYRAHDFDEPTSYVDSQVACGVFSDQDENKHMPKFFAAVPNYSLTASPTLAYGNGKWVGLFSGSQCAIVSEDNGANWKSAYLPTTTTWWKVNFANNRFIAIGGGTAVSTVFAFSDDGYHWCSPVTAPGNRTWQSLVYDNGMATNKWVGVAGGGTAGTYGIYSTATNNGSVWSGSTMPGAATAWIDCATSGAGRVVAIAGSVASTASAYSTNGSSWTAGGALASSVWQAIAYGSSKFVAISSSAVNGPTSYSTDGTSWTASVAPSLPTGQNWNSIIWTGSVFVILAGPVPLNIAAPGTAFSQYYATSSDGITWSALKVLPDYTYWFAMANNGNAVGFISTATGRFAYTPDITAATPTWSLYKNCMATWNRVIWDRRDPAYVATAGALAAVATTAGSNQLTCTSTDGLQVGTVLASVAGCPGTASFLPTTGAVVVSGIVNATTFTVNSTAIHTTTGQAPSYYKHVYQLFRSTTSGFTARDLSTLIGATNATATLYLDDSHETIPGTTYYYVLRKLSGYTTMANCSSTGTTSTITTTGNFYRWVTGVGFEGNSGSTAVISKSQNFYSLGIMPGASVSGIGIDADTHVESIVDYNQVVLTKPLTGNLSVSASTLYFSPAPGMLIYGNSVGLDAKIVSVDSPTSMTVSVPTTNTFTNKTLTFVVNEELPEIACIPQAVPIVQNNVLQNTTLATTWTSTGITPTSASVSGPLDDVFGVLAAGTTVTGSKLLATAVSGLCYQDIQTGLGQTYNFSVFARADVPDNDDYLTMDLLLGSASQRFTVGPRWNRYDLNFTTVSGLTRAQIRLPQMGTAAYIQHAMVTVGSGVSYTGTASTTAPTVLMPQQNFHVTTTTPGVAGWNYEDGSGIELNLATAPAGQKWAHIHVSTSGIFTPADSNQIFSTETTAVNEGMFYATTGTLGLLVDGYEPISSANSSNGALLVGINGATNLTIKDSKHFLNGVASYLYYLLPAYNVYLHNIDVYNPKTYIAALYPDAVTTNNSSKTLLLQNIRCNKNRLAWASQMLDGTYKGVYGGDTRKGTSAASWNLSSAPTLDSLPISSQAVYDAMFHEMVHGSGITTGHLHLMMTASSKASKPYTITSGNPYFDNYGKLYMTLPGDQIEIEWPHFIRGITGFDRRYPHIYGTDLGVDLTAQIGALVEYDLDKGLGYSTIWKRVTGNPDNLADETGIDPSVGVKPKFRITARTGLKYTGQTSPYVTGEAIYNASGIAATASAYVVEDEDLGTTGTIIASGVSGAWATANSIYSSLGQVRSTITATNNTVFFPQATSNLTGIRVYTKNDTSYRYPYSRPYLTLTGLIPGTEVRVFRTSDRVELVGTESCSSSTFSVQYDYYTDTNVYIVLMSLQYLPIRLENQVLGSTGLTIPVQQQVDRTYRNPA